MNAALCAPVHRASTARATPVHAHASYPTAPAHDLNVALAQVDAYSATTESGGHQTLLITLASDWLAQVLRDLASSHVCADHTHEFICTLCDVLALVHGVMALDLQRGDESASTLRAAATLIERAKDTLSTMEGGAA